MKESNTPVLIVGAGPTGLVLALWLKKSGIPFRIIDKSMGPGTASRAIAVQARTLEFYRQLGIADQLLSAGTLSEKFTMYRRGKVAAVAHLGPFGQDVSPFPYLLFCAQDIHEKILCDELKKLGVEVERQTEIVEFSEDSKGVRAVVQSTKGKETIRAEYLCGCDGAHSAVRHGLHTPFPGGDYSHVFFVADAQVEKMPNEGIGISFSREDFCIIMPIKIKDSVRLIGIVPPDAEAKENIEFNDVRESVARNTGLHVTKVNWFSTYHVHHRVADSFQKGRVFLAGDAGHIHSPVGGQGMNTGIGDAVNLAWKLACVLKRDCSSKLLNSYNPERISFARTLIQTTDTAFKIVASRSWIGGFFRMYIFPNAFAFFSRFRPILKFLFRTVSQTRIHYHDSFLSEGVAGNVRAGDRLPWIKTITGDNYESLRSLNWQIHIYGEAQRGFKSALPDLQIEEFPWSKEAEAKGFMENAVYLLRPDGYVAFASENQNAVMVNEYLRSI